MMVLVLLTVWMCAGRVIVFVSDQHCRLLLTYKFSIQPFMRMFMNWHRGGKWWRDDYRDKSTMINCWSWRLKSWMRENTNLFGKKKNSYEKPILFSRGFSSKNVNLKRIKFLSSRCLLLTKKVNWNVTQYLRKKHKAPQHQQQIVK